MTAVPHTTLERAERPALQVLPHVETGPEQPVDVSDGEGCTADWRRPGQYWSCVKLAGHRGRHKMRATLQPDQ